MPNDKFLSRRELLAKTLFAPHYLQEAFTQNQSPNQKCPKKVLAKTVFAPHYHLLDTMTQTPPIRSGQNLHQGDKDKDKDQDNDKILVVLYSALPLYNPVKIPTSGTVHC